MPDEKFLFAKKDINAQTMYLKDLYELMRMEVRGPEALDYGERMRRLQRPGTSFKEAESDIKAALDKSKREISKRKSAFEKKLADEPERYPLGVLFRQAHHNAFERFAVAATAAVAMFDVRDFRCFSVRTLAKLYYGHGSPIKRLDAELYFHGDNKLEKQGIVELETDRPGSLVFDGEIRIGQKAYLAILGKDGEQLEGTGDTHTRQRHKRHRGRHLGELVSPRSKLRDVVISPDALELIRRALAQAKNQGKIFEDWGLGKQVTYGRSTTILFTGPPGTGKTLAAGAFANELGKKMLLVKGSDIVSPWHGEDEQNAARTFMQAKDADAVLVFDEADSFFYARHGVRHSMDMSSNRTVNVFLGCLEEHELPVILTTNRADSLDPALERRISTKVVFDPPNTAERARIWRLHLPRKMPLSDDVDIKELATKYPLTGGQIKNAVVAAARTAVYREASGNGGAVVTMGDLEDACRIELEGSRIFGTAEREIGFKAAR